MLDFLVLSPSVREDAERRLDELEPSSLASKTPRADCPILSNVSP